MGIPHQSVGGTSDCEPNANISLMTAINASYAALRGGYSY